MTHPRDSVGGDIADVLAGLGPRIRMLRTERHCTLETLAAAAQISPAHLSRLETQERQPSLAVAMYLAGALGLSLSDLLGSAEHIPDEGIVVRAATAPRRTVDGVVFQDLTPRRGQQLIHAVRVTVPVRPRGAQRGTHVGEQWLFVVSGRLRFAVGDDNFVLETGDAANFDGSIPHLLSGEGGDAEILVVACAAQAH